MADTPRIIRNEAWNPLYFAYLTPVLMMTMLVNQMLVLKSIDVFGLSIVASTITYPLSLIVCDIMTEVYGYKRTRKAIWLCLSLYVLSLAFTQLVVYWPPATDYANNDMFVAIFSNLPQIVLAGVLAYLAGELVNSYILSRLKTHTDGKLFYYRALLSTLISQALNCTIFFGIGFWGVMPFSAMVESWILSMVIILAYETLCLPITHKIANRLKQAEGVDYFDR
jgi:queuosine precursor transporter